MLTQYLFYRLPKERLANLVNCPSSFEINGDLRLKYVKRSRRGEILLSDCVLPEILGARPTPLPYVPIGTQVEIRAATEGDLGAIRAYLNRVVKQFAV